MRDRFVHTCKESYGQRVDNGHQVLAQRNPPIGYLLEHH